MRRTTWLVLRRPENRDEQDEQLLARLIAQHPDLAQAIELSQDFAQILRERSPERLEPWLTRAVRSQLGALVGFALRLGEDYEAVKAGVTLEWSNGQVEGQINRLKMLKRQMYGRVKFDLLSQRVLLAV
nr:transposase [Nostoc sp. ChiQUE02]MDZ8233510.1 transposase [Nostoc sp. ChiQUE02]